MQKIRVNRHIDAACWAQVRRAHLHCQPSQAVQAVEPNRKSMMAGWRRDTVLPVRSGLAMAGSTLISKGARSPAAGASLPPAVDAEELDSVTSFL